MDNCIFKSIFLQDETPIRVLLTVLEKSLELFLFQCENAWKSIVNKEDLNVFCTQLKLNVEDYCENLLEYITNLDSKSIFVLDDDEFVVQRFVANSLKMKVFTCKLQKVNYFEHAQGVIEKFYSEGKQMYDRLATLEKEKDECEKHKTACESQLKELVQRKSVEEEEQLGRFVLVLNEKKRKIQHLSELLGAFRSGRPALNPAVKTKSRKKRDATEVPAAKKETISESESSDSYCTDNEGEPGDVKIVTDQPSTSKVDEILLLDDFLLNEEIAPSRELPKRTKRDPRQETVTVSTSKAKTEKPEDVTRSKRKPPTVDFSTQSLFDQF